MRNWRRIGAGGWLATAIVASSVAAQETPVPPPESAPAAPLEIPESDVPRLRDELLAADARAEQRDQAARRLVSRRTPESVAALRSILTDPAQPSAHLAIARALSTDAAPDPTLIDPLFALLSDNAPRTLADAVTRSLAAYKFEPAVLPRLLQVLDRARSDALRIPVIRALGTFVDKRAAEALVRKMESSGDEPDIFRAAGDALVYMTGYVEFGRDLDRWRAWYAQASQLSEADFRSQLLNARAARFDRTIQRYAALAEELGIILAQQHAALPPEQRGDFLLRLLRSSQPAIRASGAQLMENDFRVSGVAAPEVRAQLRTMVGDSDAEVRLQVASALAVLNDADALVPLLTQLRQERDPSVRAELARALAPIRDIRAVPVLLEMLADPSVEAAAAAALALREMGAQIAADPALRERVARTLIGAFEARTSGGPAGTKTFPLREALLRAMIPLKDESVAPLLRRVLSARPRESARAREAAIEGLAEFGPRESEPIIGQLDDDDPAVRRRAVRVLPRVTTFGDVSERLRRRLDPGTEPDGSIRTEAWNALSVLINDASAQQLAPWVDRFADEPERQRLVLLRLAMLADQIGDQDELASRRQQIGDSYMRTRLFGDAAEYYEDALEYSIRSRAPTLVLLTRSEATLDALLGARQYDRAAALAGRMIALNPGEFVTSMGGKIALEADRLTRAGEYEPAQRLIERARAIDPPLPDRIIDRLRETEQDILRFRSEPRPNQ